MSSSSVAGAVAPVTDQGFDVGGRAVEAGGDVAYEHRHLAGGQPQVGGQVAARRPAQDVGGVAAAGVER